MKKCYFLIVFTLLGLIGFSQTTKDSLNTHEAKVRDLKFRAYFMQINPDTLASKKGIIFIGKTNAGTNVYYIRIDKKYYIINDVSQVLKLHNGNKYYLKLNNDSLQILEENSNIPLLKYQ